MTQHQKEEQQDRGEGKICIDLYGAEKRRGKGRKTVTTKSRTKGRGYDGKQDVKGKINQRKRVESIRKAPEWQKKGMRRCPGITRSRRGKIRHLEVGRIRSRKRRTGRCKRGRVKKGRMWGASHKGHNKYQRQQ